MENKSPDNDETNQAESRTKAGLKRLIEELARLKKHFETLQETMNNLNLHKMALDNSNWKLDLELQKVCEELSQLQKEASIKSQESKKSLEKLEFGHAQNSQWATDLRSNFQEEVQKYSFMFLNGHIEYNVDNLTSEIDAYRKEAKLLRENIEKAQQKMETLKDQYNLIASGMTEEAKLSANIKTAKEIIKHDNSLLIREIKSFEEKNKIAKLKIKEVKEEIAHLQNKLK